ncbi:hypothetical protein BD414DRAFT_415208 [Trametes punicea]|nr:hypothetical protein BD414DRAFT_415208 [Trametes punicea]
MSGGSMGNEVMDIARKAIEIFARHGLKCCLVGSVASYVYGVLRTPNDVDLVVLTTLHCQESLKAMLVAADSGFYLVRSRNPYASYKVLWYRNKTSWSSLPWKVDILVPGIMDIPNVPPDRIVRRAPHHLPLMPLIPQLLLKLQAWSDHRDSHRVDLRMKQYTDVDDINKLLEIACLRGHRVHSPDLSWMPTSMVSVALRRLRSYVVHAAPESKAKWRRLGFQL